ncbi:hypothetical protein ABZ297_05055 [Nonomuraea sp. NPDC005983]|uniref:hypothetical protein n=1 Tax=Nonomuraea sp. NPDC005983 TaxID=3155595 RepID=UPI0033B5D599
MNTEVHAVESPQWAARIRAVRKARLWDVHTMARRLRTAAGDDGRDLPDHESLVRSIRRWESGKISVLSERYRLLFCRALEVAEASLFSDPIEVPAPRPQSAAHHDLDAMSSFRGADRRVGGGHLYATVMGYLEQDVAPRLFGGSDGATAFVAAAAFTEMAGWMAHDAGQDDAAHRHFARALDLAGVGGDRELEAHILGSMSYLARHLGCPDDAVQLAQRGTTMLVDTRTAAPAMKSRLLTMAARGFAAQGEAGECTRLLIRAEKALGQRMGEAASPWTGPFDEGALTLDAARCMLRLGHLGEAQRQARRAIALRPADRTRSRAFGQVVLARVLLAEGQLDEACALIIDVIADTRSLSSLVVTRQLAGLQGLLKAYRGNKTLTEPLKVLNGALRERCWLYQWGGSRREPGGPALRA